MKPRRLSVIAGVSYLVIFFAAVFANFFVLESIRRDPLETIQSHDLMVRFGIIAFMITVAFDVVVAWALYELYRHNSLALLSTFFRMMHAAVMAVAIFALPASLTINDREGILQQLDIFNTIWLIGLFFFGLHLILLGNMLNRPKWISTFLVIAGIAYMLDTVAHFLLKDYNQYASLFLGIVAIPSIIGEMAFAVWLLLKNGK